MNKIEKITHLFAQLPGIGKKTALRFVHFLLKESSHISKQIAQELSDLHEVIQPCSECGNLTETNPCNICSNAKRDAHQLCVVAIPQDINAVEESGSYEGLYHVLGGLISPLHGIGPEKLRITELKKKIESKHITEVILATSPTIEGETTARYIYELCKNDNATFTRIAQGMPMGANFEYTDKFTIAHALRTRAELQ